MGIFPKGKFLSDWILDIFPWHIKSKPWLNKKNHIWKYPLGVQLWWRVRGRRDRKAWDLLLSSIWLICHPGLVWLQQLPNQKFHCSQLEATQKLLLKIQLQKHGNILPWHTDMNCSVIGKGRFKALKLFARSCKPIWPKEDTWLYPAIPLDHKAVAAVLRTTFRLVLLTEK